MVYAETFMEPAFATVSRKVTSRKTPPQKNRRRITAGGSDAATRGNSALFKSTGA